MKNLGNLLNKGVMGYTNLVDKVLNMPMATAGIGAASGIPGMDKILNGIEKLIPDGGIKLGGNNPAATTKNQLGSPTTNVTKSTTSNAVTTADVVPFDIKKWSTYPMWAKYSIYAIVPAGLLLWLFMGNKSKKNNRKY